MTEKNFWDDELDAMLVLEDGRYFQGKAFGARRVHVGELVFNTSMCGYQEILTDPSYAGQLVTMTYPHIGNYGVNLVDLESGKIWASGLIVRSITASPSNWRAEQSLPDWLEQHDIPGISEIDTRELTRHIRDKGVMKALIAPGYGPEQLDELLGMLADAPAYGDSDFVAETMVSEPMRVVLRGSVEYDSRVELVPVADQQAVADGQPGADAPKVSVVDFGVKRSILRHLAERGCDVTLLPASSSAEQISTHGPDGVLLSNGPGDPAQLDALAQELSQILDKQPTFAICLGHQVLARAAGAETFKLPFGHRGPNQPVKELESGKIAMTSQNHGYAVEQESMPEELEVTHINLNDHTVAGFKHRELPVVAVQYHPEAGPGPHDASDFFDAFYSAAVTRRASRS